MTKNIKEITVTRTFNASIEEVWKLWMEPEFVKKWWGPQIFTCPIAKIDFREGGISLVCMRSPDGQDFYSTLTYQKIVPMQRIEYIHNLADKDGQRIDPTTVGMPEDFPQDVRNVITFKTVADNNTEMTDTEYMPITSMYENARLGLEQCIDKIAKALAE